MIKLLDIKKDVKRGDLLLVAQMTDIPMSTIKAVMSGRRNSETDHAQEVLKAAKKVIAKRKQLLAPIGNSKPAARNSKKVPIQIEIFPSHDTRTGKEA